jgi:hypothetical protein
MAKASEKKEARSLMDQRPCFWVCFHMVSRKLDLRPSPAVSIVAAISVALSLFASSWSQSTLSICFKMYIPGRDAVSTASSNKTSLSFLGNP